MKYKIVRTYLQDNTKRTLVNYFEKRSLAEEYCDIFNNMLEDVFRYEILEED